MVKGRAFSWGNKLSFQDMNGNEYAFIDQKLLSWNPTYEIFVQGNKFAALVKNSRWFDKSFTLDLPGPNDYEIEGSFWRHEYTFRRRGVVVARISKERWRWTESYGVEIAAGEAVVSILCACIIIDQILHQEKDDKDD